LPKIYRLLLIFITFFLVGKQVAAQDKKGLDSLLAVATKQNTDTNSVKAFTEVLRYFFNLGQYDSAHKYSLMSLSAARKVNDRKLLAKALYNAGMICTNLTKYDSAKLYLAEANIAVTAIKDTALQINIYNAYALMSNYQSDFDASVAYQMKAARLIESSQNPDIKNLLPQTYGNIGHNLIAEKQIEKGIEYEKKALLIKNYPNEQRYTVMIHLDITDAYIQLNENTKARSHLDSAVLLNKSLNNIQVTTLVINTEGVYYNAVNDWPAALTSYLAAYKIADSVKNEYLQSEAGDNVAKMYLKLGNLNEAEKYALESNNIARLLNNFTVAASTYNTLKESAAKKGNFEKAFQFAGLNKLYADSASNNESKKSILNLEAKYQNQKKEKEIADLTIANKEKELAVVKRNRLLTIGGISAAALLLTIGLFYRNSKQQQLLTEKENTLQQEQIKFLERQQQVVSLQSMLNGQETERTRIAKDLHDGLGGLFSTVKMYFSTLKHEQEVLQSNELFGKSYELIDTASEEVRRIAHNMMPEVLMKLGLIHALQDMCSNISAGKLLQAKLQWYGMEQRMNASTEIMLYRIVQELLNNIIKHAQASEAIVQFNRDTNRLTVTVEDNGRGFNLQETDHKNHAGLETVKSRVSYLNGNISIDSKQEVGTTVMMEFLINDEA
jgi:two-component system, NarL family, sensor kinase